MGIEANPNGRMLYPTEPKFHDMLGGCAVLDCKPISVPVVLGSKLSLHDGDHSLDPTLLHRRVMGLPSVCLTPTQPDTASAINSAR